MTLDELENDTPINIEAMVTCLGSRHNVENALKDFENLAGVDDKDKISTAHAFSLFVIGMSNVMNTESNYNKDYRLDRLNVGKENENIIKS